MKIVRHHIAVCVKAPPVVELDSEARAAYVRFTNEKVAQTKVLESDGCLITIDLDAKENLIGVELVNVDEFNINCLMDKAGIALEPSNIGARARYVPARSLQPA